MEIAFDEIGAIKVLRLAGALDEIAAEKMTTVLEELFQAGQVKLLCDLSKTTDVSEAGVRMFLQAFRKVHEANGQIAFCLAQPEVKAKLQSAGLTHLYKYYDLGEALQFSILKELSAHLAEYLDLHEIRLQRQEEVLRIDLFLEFDGNKRMAVVQESISKIKNSLEEKIKGSEVCIIPTAG